MKFDINELVADYVKTEIVDTDIISEEELMDCFREQSISLMEEIDNFSASVKNIFSQIEIAKIVMKSLENVLRKGWETCRPEDANEHYDEGYKDGHSDGYDEGYDDGHSDAENGD